MVSSICLLIYWNIYSIDITLVIGLVDKLCDIIGYVDTTAFSNFTQLVFHYAFSFWFRIFGGSFTYIFYMVQMAFLSQDSQMGISKLRQLGLLQLWSPITLQSDLGSRCSIRQSYSSHRKLSNGMLHIVCN